MRRKNRPVKHGPTRPKIRRQWGTERRSGAAPDHAPGAVAPRDERRTFRALPDGGGLAGVLRRAGAPVRRPSVRRPRHDRGRRLPAARDAADGVGGRVPARAPRPPAARPRAPARAARRDRRGLRRVEPDAHRDRARRTRRSRRVIRQTLLSAALQEFPNLRVVLLIDDPPNPRAIRREAPARRGARPAGRDRRAARRCLAATSRRRSTPSSRAPPGSKPARRGRRAARGDLLRRRRLAPRDMAEDEDVTDHVDAFLVERGRPRPSPIDLETVAGALRDALAADAEISAARMRQLYRRLVWIFRAELSSFERKRFASLSHEPNKAMNLNSYIGLMGGRYRIRETAERRDPPAGARRLVRPRGAGSRLRADARRRQHAAARVLPAARRVHGAARERRRRGRPDAVLRVPRRADAHRADRRRDDRPAAHRPPGADALRRHLLGRRQRGPPQARARHGHDRGVAQRLHDPPLHQGPHGHRGHRVEHRPAHARLASRELPRAAQLQRDAARLRLALRPARSAGPTAACSSCRGSSRLARRRDGRSRRAVAAEMFLRLNYLASISWASAGLWLLLFYPFDQQLLSRYAVLTALPYFVAISTDLRRCGYKRLDVLPALRPQPDAAAGQHGRRGALDRAGDRRPEERLRAHAEGAEAAPSRRSRSWRSRSCSSSGRA